MTRPNASAPGRPGADREPVSRARLLAFWVVLLLIPLGFFVALEGGLRLADYGSSYPLFTEVDGLPGYLVQSRDVGRRYFRHAAAPPTSAYDVFEEVRSENSFRLFVQGGSSAAGFPYYRGGAFPRMLKARLEAGAPDRYIEVVNTSMAAVNSFTLLDLAPEITRQQPDAVLIYAGHNEYYGALGVGSTERMSTSRWLVKGYLRMQHLRTVQLLTSGLARLASSGSPRDTGPPGESLMAQMVGQQSIPFGSPAYTRGLRQFEGNLRDLLRTYRRADVPVYVATLAFNERDHAPFSSVFQKETNQAAWQAEYQKARDLIDAGEADAAIAILSRLTSTDTLNASGFFLLGQALERAQRFDDARAAYRAAGDRDALRFRAPTAFNDIIRRVAAEEGAVVVDVEAHMAAAAPDGIIGADEMLEHLHPTLYGYSLIADAFYDALLGTPPRAVPDFERIPASQARGLVRLTLADSLLGELRVRRLMAGWPFAELGASAPAAESFLPPVTPEARAALDLYYGRATWLEGTEALAGELEREGRLAEALRTREAMVQAFPVLAEPHLGLGAQLVRMGEVDRAVRSLRLAIDRGDRSGNAHGLLGAIELQRGMAATSGMGDVNPVQQFDRARELLEHSHRLNPRNAQTLYNLSGAYAKLGRIDEARRTATLLLRLQPEHAAGRQLLASLPAPAQSPDGSR